MNIGIIGSGGREHSLCFKLLQSKKVKKIFCIPGNAGTKEICKNLDIDILDFNKLYLSIKKEGLLGKDKYFSIFIRFTKIRRNSFF